MLVEAIFKSMGCIAKLPATLSPCSFGFGPLRGEAWSGREGSSPARLPKASRHLVANWEAFRLIDVLVDDGTQLPTRAVRQLLSIARQGHLAILGEGIAKLLHLSEGKVMQTHPLHIEEPAEAIERICTSELRPAHSAPHLGIALESFAALDGEEEEDCTAAVVGLIQLLLILPLRRPHVVTDRFHNVLGAVARDHKVPSIVRVESLDGLPLTWSALANVKGRCRDVRVERRSIER